MSAAEIAQTLHGRRSGRGWVCRCPAHEDKSPSLSVCDGEGGKLLVYCHAGCDPRDILRKLRSLGLDSKSESLSVAVAKPASATSADMRTDYARSIWRQALPPYQTPVSTYLRTRGYRGYIPLTLRYYPNLLHKPTGKRTCAMIAAVTVGSSRRIQAVHRTYLEADGSAKLRIEPNRMMLGSVKGGAVRLAPGAPLMAVSEGIETGLSVMASAGVPTWAALSAGGLENLILPPLPLGLEVTIAADHDPSGRGQIAAEKAARRWIAEGRHVRIALPFLAGTDFNDVFQDNGA